MPMSPVSHGPSDRGGIALPNRARQIGNEDRVAGERARQGDLVTAA